MTYHDQASNAFEALEDPGKGKCPGGMTLAVARETYEYGVKNTMDNESIRGLDGQFKLVAKSAKWRSGFFPQVNSCGTRFESRP